MAHVRTQIRTAFKAALDGSLPTSDYEVYASRKFSLNLSDTSPATVDMMFTNENIAQQTMGDERLRTATLIIRCQRPARDETLDDLLDADEVVIFNAIAATDFSALLEEDPELMQVNFSDDATSEVPVGAIVLRYDVEYRVTRDDTETVRQ